MKKNGGLKIFFFIFQAITDQALTTWTMFKKMWPVEERPPELPVEASVNNLPPAVMLDV
jgi:hypothetical protein